MFELEDGTRIDTSGFNDFQMTFFKENFPGAKEIVNIEAENFPKDSANAETNVESGNNTVSKSEDTSSELNIPKENYFTYTGPDGVNRKMTEAQYNKSLAGKSTTRGTYPQSFEAYRKSLSQRSNYEVSDMLDDNQSFMLDEVVVSAPGYDKEAQVFDNNNKPTEIAKRKGYYKRRGRKGKVYVKGYEEYAEEINNLTAGVNENSVKNEIGASYFRFNDDNILKRYSGERRDLNPAAAGYSGTTKFIPNFKDDAEYEQYYKEQIGEDAFDAYKKAQILARADGKELNKNNVGDYIDLSAVPSDYKIAEINKKKKSESQIYFRKFDEELQDQIRRYTGDDREKELKAEFVSKKNRFLYDEKLRIEKDKEEFEELTGRPLLFKTTIDGKVYDPDAKTLDETKAFQNIKKQREQELIAENDKVFKLAEQLDEDYKTLNEYSDEINNYNVDSIKEYNSPAEVKKRTDLLQKYAALFDKMSKDEEVVSAKYNKLMDDIKVFGDTQVIDDAVLKDYRYSTKFAHVMEEAFLGSGNMLLSSIGKGIADLAALPIYGVGYNRTALVDKEGDWYQGMMRNKRNAIDYNRQLQEFREIYLPDRLTKSDSSTAGQYFADMLVENSPSILVALSTAGYGGLVGAGSAVVRAAAARQAANVATGIFFTMEAGGQLSNVEIAQQDAEKTKAQLEELRKKMVKDGASVAELREIDEQIQEQTELLSLSQFQKSFNAAMYGGIAGFAERFGTLKFIQNFNKYSKAVGGNKLRGLFGNQLGTTLSRTTGIGAGIGIGVGIEQVEEGLTLIGQNLADNLIFQPKKQKSLIEGLDGEFFRNTLVTSLGISGPTAAPNLYTIIREHFTTKQEAIEIAKKRDKLISIQKRIDEIGDARKKESRDLVKQRNELLLGFSDLSDKIMFRAKDLTVEDIQTIFDNKADIEQLKRRADDLGLEITDPEYQELNEEAQTLFDSSNNILLRSDKKLRKEAREAANPIKAKKRLERYNLFKYIAENNRDKQVVNLTSQEEIFDYAEKNFKRLKNGNPDVQYKEFIAAAFGIETNIKGKRRAALKQAQEIIEKKKFKQKVIGSNASYVNNSDIVLFEENAYNAMLNGIGIAGDIASVSPLHELGHQQVKSVGLIKNNKIVNDSAQGLIDSVNEDITRKRDNGEISEENFKVFKDRIKAYETEDGVDVDELIQLVSDFTALGILKKNDYLALFNAKTLINNILKRVNGEAFSMFKVNTADDLYNFVSQFQNRAYNYLLDLKQGDLDKETKFSKLLDKVKVRLSSIPPGALEETAAQNIIANELYGMVEAQIRNRFNLKPDQIEELTADVVARIYVAQENTKWDGRGTLYGFLNGRIAKRILDALKANPDYLDVVTKQELTGLEKASQVVDDQPAVTKEKPKKKNLLQSNVLPADQLQNVKDKLIRVIRVLKSRLDAPKSINRTVSPIIAEIKKEMGKQADIEFKKRLGPKKDGILRKNYLRFKKPILENMTTTWLMTAMPFAVQKQVDGKFTSDWQGKKIDRETVDTDKAGRTSGADIVRRLPNIAEKVTDEQFLSYMFKGNEVIRGRKESLSKAMAEELSFDILSKELNDTNSALREAFKQNQSQLGVELAENFVQEVEKDIERGNIKFSKSAFGSLSPGKFRVFKSKMGDVAGAIATLDGDYGRTPTVIKNILQNIYEDEFTKQQYLSIAKNFFNRLKSVNTAIDNAPAILPSQEEVIDFLIDVALDTETNESILQYTGANKNSFAVDPEVNVFNNSQNVQDARDNIENSLIKALKSGELRIAEIVAFFSGTFANSGQVGVYLSVSEKTGKQELKFRSDLYAGESQWMPALKRIIPNLKSITNNTIILKDGTEVQRDISPSSSVGVKMLKGTFDTANNKRSAEAAFNFTKTIIKGLKNQPPVIQAMVLATLNSGTNTSLRAAAPVVWNTVGFDSMDKDEYRYEHMTPARKVLYDMFRGLVLGQKVDLDAVQKDYQVAIIPKIMDKVIGDVQLGRFTIPNHIPGVTPNYYRYYNLLTRGRVQFAIKKIADPSVIVGQNYADYFNQKDKPNVKLDAPQVVERSIAYEKAFKESKNLDYGKFRKGITVLDFDDTIAISDSKVIVITKEIQDQLEMNNEIGNRILKERNRKKIMKSAPKITPAEFATKSEELEAKGAKFDFSEFNKVVKGRKGPLFDLALKRQAKFGNDNIFILTARPQASATAIQKFAKGLGLSLKLKNITGLENGSPQAKADWIVGKVNEGFNDFYFADDALKNVKAVQNALNLFDVKSDIQQAKTKFSKNLNNEVNQMIFRNKGIRAEATYSKVVARRKGARKGRFKIFVPYGAEDFRGLTSYVLAGKGKQGEADQKFFEDNLVDPYVQGVAAMERARRALKTDYLGLRKMFPSVKKRLNKKLPGLEYTLDQAIRVYLYNKSGFEIPGLSKRDLNKIIKLIEGDVDIKGFTDGLQLITKKDKWVQPSEFWDTSNILKDLNEMSEKVNRQEYLAEFIENVDAIFDQNTLNKLEAIYGTAYTDALKNIIGRMKSGINRPTRPGKYERKWLNWTNNSVGTIMFFNRRSALLQLISTANFINWSDNNPIKAAAAFANQPRYWKTWVQIFNSPKLKERRGGLRSDIQEQEIANQAKNSKDTMSAITAYLLKIGFTPTQIADSIAIATGGAAFLMNRTDTYLSQGLSKEEADRKAFEDFTKISDETQQSGDPMLISAQQASHLGRLILAFQNTPMQYTRLMKKAMQDIANGRGDLRTNLSKIIYYGFIQNLLFNTMQQALFALLPGFDDEDEENMTEEQLEKLDVRERRKYITTLNNMIDSILRGSGLTGAVISTLKNTIMRYQREKEKGFTGDHAYTLIELANISPPIGSKLRKVYNSILTNDVYDRDVIKSRGLSVIDPLDDTLNLSPSYQVIGNLTSAFFNLPLDRVIAETNAIAEMLDDRNTSYQRIALMLGWRTWDVNAKNETHDLIKLQAKAIRKEESKRKAKETRELNQLREMQKLAMMSPKEKEAYLAAEKKKRSDAAKKAAATRARNKKIKDSILRSQ